MDPEGGSPVGSIVGVSQLAGHSRRQLTTDGIRRRGQGPWRPGPGHRQTRGPVRPTAVPWADGATSAVMPGPEQAAAAARPRVAARAPSCSPVAAAGGWRRKRGGAAWRWRGRGGVVERRGERRGGR